MAENLVKIKLIEWLPEPNDGKPFIFWATECDDLDAIYNWLLIGDAVSLFEVYKEQVYHLLNADSYSLSKGVESVVKGWWDERLAYDSPIVYVDARNLLVALTED